jgi:hypothetical protein
MRYYLNGQEIDSRGAMNGISFRAEQQGMSDDDWASAWRSRADSEEAREYLNEISGYEIELVPE